MSDVVRVVVDGMGGDNAPSEIVKGAVAAVKDHDEIRILLTGYQDVLERELKQYAYPGERIQVIHTSQVIETAEPPVAAIRTKKDSSIVAGLMMVRRGEADAFVSAGSTGAVLVGAQAIVGKLVQARQEFFAQLCKGITQEEADAFFSMVDKMTENLSGMKELSEEEKEERL